MTNHFKMNRSAIINNNDHLLENKEVKLAFLVYEDYECEHCGKAFVELKALRELYDEDF